MLHHLLNYHKKDLKNRPPLSSWLCVRYQLPSSDFKNIFASVKRNDSSVSQPSLGPRSRCVLPLLVPPWCLVVPTQRDISKKGKCHPRDDTCSVSRMLNCSSTLFWESPWSLCFFYWQVPCLAPLVTKVWMHFWDAIFFLVIIFILSNHGHFVVIGSLLYIYGMPFKRGNEYFCHSCILKCKTKYFLC